MLPERQLREIVQRDLRPLFDRHTDVLRAATEAAGAAVSARIERLAEHERHDADQQLQVLGELSWTIGDFREAVTSGFVRLSHHLDLMQGELVGLRNLLSAPLATAGRELRARAEFASAQGWVNEALTDFLEAERKNYQDFLTHLHIGNLYLGLEKDHDALGYFHKAAKYAKPHSDRIGAIALRNAACVRGEKLGDVDGAYRDASEARRLDTAHLDVAYVHARYSALTRHDSEAIASLREVLTRCPEATVEVGRESAFARLRSQIDYLVEVLAKETRVRVAKELEDLAALVTRINDLAAGSGVCDDDLRAINAGNEQVRVLMTSPYYVAVAKAERLCKQLRLDAVAPLIRGCDHSLGILRRRSEGLKTVADEARSRQAFELAAAAREARHRAETERPSYTGRGWLVCLTTWFGLAIPAHYLGSVLFPGSGVTFLAATYGPLVLGILLAATGARKTRARARDRFLREAAEHDQSRDRCLAEAEEADRQRAALGQTIEAVSLEKKTRPA